MKIDSDLTHRIRPVLTAALVVCSCLAGGAIANAQDFDAMSVGEFVQKQSKWSQLRGTTLKVEGRYRSKTDRQMLFTNCDDLLFEFADGVRQPTSRSRTVQVTGKLGNSKQGKLVFVVTEIEAIPSDTDRLADRRGRLAQDDAAPWYELADWAARRGRFYQDDELISAAAELRNTGVRIEYRQTGIADIEPLYALARKAEKLGLPHKVRDELIHDAVRRELRDAQQKDEKQRAVALTRAFNLLPGAGAAVIRDDKVRALQAEYEQKPLAVYERSDDETRRILNRLLYSAAVLERIELRAAQDGSNGFEIAKHIEDTLPELAERAEEYRQREIAWQSGRLRKLSRDELLTLCERLEQRDLKEDAVQARRDWLAAQEPRLRELGNTGLFDLAKEYVALLDDADAAAQIYIELYKSRTGQQTAGAELVKLGYQFDGSKWTKAADAVPDATSDAILRGIVRRGMTDSQVRAALGKPSSVTRFAVRNQVSEFWVYEDHGVAIELRRRGAGSDSIATEISDLAGL